MAMLDLASQAFPSLLLGAVVLLFLVLSTAGRLQLWRHNVAQHADETVERTREREPLAPAGGRRWLRGLLKAWWPRWFVATADSSGGAVKEVSALGADEWHTVVGLPAFSENQQLALALRLTCKSSSRGVAGHLPTFTVRGWDKRAPWAALRWAVTTRPLFRHLHAVRHLVLHSWRAGCFNTLAAAVVATPGLSSLRSLTIGAEPKDRLAAGSCQATSLFDMLLTATHFTALQELRLRLRAAIGDEGAPLVAQVLRDVAPQSWRLQHLQIDGAMTDLGVAHIADVLRTADSLSMLRVLDLRHNRIGSLGAHILVVSLRAATHLTSLRALDLSMCRIGPSGILSLASLLFASSHLRLESLRLAGNNFRDGAAAYLTNCLVKASHLHGLTELDLAVSKREDADASWDVSPLFRHLSRLRGLRLQRHPVGDASVGRAMAALAAGELPALEQLHVKDCRLNAEGACSIAALLRNYPFTGLQTLELRRTGGFDHSTEATGALTDALRYSTHLATLQNLRLVGILEDGGRAVLAALQAATHLQRLAVLDLSHNPLHAHRLGWLLRCGTHLGGLREIRLKCCGLVLNGAEQVGAALVAATHLRRLRVLSLDRNGIGDNGADELARMLRTASHLCGLESLGLAFNGILLSGFAELAGALRDATHLTALRKLDLSNTASVCGDMLERQGQAIVHINDQGIGIEITNVLVTALRSATHLARLHKVILGRSLLEWCRKMWLLEHGSTGKVCMQRLEVAVRDGAPHLSKCVVCPYPQGF